MKNLSLLNKLLLAFGCCMVIVLGLSGIAVSKLSTMNDNVSAFADNRLPKAVALGQLEGKFAAYRTSMYRHIAAGTDQMQGADNAVKEARRSTEEAHRRLGGLVTAPEAKAAVARITGILPEITRRDDAALALSRQGKDAAALQALLDVRAESNKLAREIEALRSIFERQDTKAKEAAADDYASSKLLIAAAVVTAFAIILATLFAMVRLVSRPLNDLTIAIGDMAGGKLDVVLD